MKQSDISPVPQFDNMIRNIIRWNGVLAFALILIAVAITQSVSMALGLLVGSILATLNAILLARKLKAITAMNDPKLGQASMLGGMGLRFLIMGAGIAFAVMVLGLDKLGIAGLIGAIALFQIVTGWQASRGVTRTAGSAA